MANPTGAYPSTATIDALNGTTNGETGLSFITKGTKPTSSPTLMQQIDRRWDRQNAILAASNQGRVVKVDDTHIGVFEAQFRIAGVDYEYSGEASTAITIANDTYYIYLDKTSDDGDSDAFLEVTDATGWPDDPNSYIPLAEVTVSGNIISAIKDVRNWSRLSSTVSGFKPGKTTCGSGVLPIPITHGVVDKTTGGVEALSLADGTPGQMLTIFLGTDGGNGTLTPTRLTGFATIVFEDAGDHATLLYVDDTVGWTIVGLSGVAGPPAMTV